MKFYHCRKVQIITAGLMLAGYLLMAVFIVDEELHSITASYDKDLSSVAHIVASDQTVIEELKAGDSKLINTIAAYYEDVPELSLIEVLDMNSVRYAHVDKAEVGSVYLYDDSANAFLGKQYFTTGDSSLGTMRKSFVPIYDGNTQVGVVVVQILNQTILQSKIQKIVVFGSVFALTYILSIIGMIWLSRKFKHELFGLRPEEIALLYAENKSVINQLNESLLSIDCDYKITMINACFQKTFHVEKSVIGKPVDDVFPYIDFKRIIDEENHITNSFKRINELKYLMNAFPIYIGEKVIGATAIFRSHLEVDSLIDQIKGYQQIAEALRSQKHEFQNKLHVVLGLIKMKDYEQAENYIMERVYTTNLASDYYTSRIKDDKVLALFVGKEIQSKEYNASLLLTSDSYLSKRHSPISSDDVVLILGNLIDNSFEAYVDKDIDDKRIVVDIFEDNDLIKFTVIDQAGGIDQTVIDKIFERGISTKNGHGRGTGLSLVNEIVSLYQGEKHISSSALETKIEVLLMKVKE